MTPNTLEYILLTERECESCSFRAYLPKLETTQRVLCPRCWQPFSQTEEAVQQSDAADVRFTSFVREPAPCKPRPPAPVVDGQRRQRRRTASNSNTPLPARQPAEPQVETAGGWDHDPAPQFQQDAPEPICLQTEEPDEELSFRERLRRRFAGYGASFCFHAVLLGLAALIVFQSSQFEWDTELDSSFSESDALFAFERMTAVEAPEFTFQPEQTTVTDVASLVDAETQTVAAGIAANNDAAGEGNVGFFGTRADGNSFAFIVDVSGSMSSPFYQAAPPDQNGQPPRRFTRWDKAREELLNAVDSMTEEQTFSVMLYNGTHYQFQLEPGSSGLYPATKANKQALSTWLSTRFAGGGTDPRSAIAQSLALQPEVVFFLTDGIIPYESREVALTANQSESIIHTTCIGSVENEILQLIAQDHRGNFRAVVDGNSVPVSSSTFTNYNNLTLLCVVSDSRTELTKFRRLQKTEREFREALAQGNLQLNPNSMLVLHNAASTIPEFRQEVQQLLRHVNTGTTAGYPQELHAGRIGMGLPLDGDRPKDFLKTLADIHSRTATIEKVLAGVVPAQRLQKPGVSIAKVIVLGDRAAKQSVLSAVEVYNLYNGSTMNVLDGDELLQKSTKRKN